MKVIDSNAKRVALILCIYILSRLPLLLVMPLTFDEALYSTMIFEQMHHPTLIPTFLGYPVGWKPGLFFWSYAAFALPFINTGFPLEAVFRMPSFLFGLASILPLYLVLRKAGASEDSAFISIIVFILSGVSIYAQSSLLTDSALFFFVILALYLYMDERFGRWRFLAAGLAAFIAFFFKSVFAFMIPVLALAWFFLKDRRMLKDPLFLISLSAPFIALGIHYNVLQGAGLGQLFVQDISGHLLSQSGLIGQLHGAYGALGTLVIYSPIWIGLFIAGIARDWRKNLFMASWAALAVIPLLSNATLPSYFLPVLPPLAFFAASILLESGGKERMDLFFLVTFVILAIASLSLFYLLECQEYRLFMPEKEAGMLLAGKADALVIGDYAPSILAYKMGQEYRAYGAPLDVGWVFLQPDINQSSISDFISDYGNSRYNVTEGSLSSGFTESINFRKDSNITRFEYIVTVGRDYQPPDDWVPLFSDDISLIHVYKVG